MRATSKHDDACGPTNPMTFPLLQIAGWMVLVENRREGLSTFSSRQAMLLRLTTRDPGTKRRQRRSPLTFCGMSCVSFLMLAGFQTVAAQSYSTASGINNSGAIAGGSCINDCQELHALLAERGGFVDFGTFGGPGSLAFGLNDRGEVVGQSDTGELTKDGELVSLAFLADGRGVRNLGAPPGYRFSQAFAINNQGLIVGWVYNSPPVPAAPPVAVMFQRDGRIQSLGTLGGASSVAFGLNDRGQIVGRSRTANGEQHAFVYERGTMKGLGTLGGNFSSARAINAQGWIVGSSRLASPGRLHAFLYTQGSMSDLGTLGGTDSEAFAINNAGQIVGVSDTRTGERHAFAYRGGKMVDLGTLGGNSSIALGINDRGDIVGEAETATGEVHAFLYRDGQMHDLAGFE